MARPNLNVSISRSARSWLGTPYVLGQRERGVGVDCANLLAGIGIDVGVLRPEDIPTYDVPEEFWLTQPTYIEDRLEEIRSALRVGTTFNSIRMSALGARSLWWQGDAIIPGDFLLLGTKDDPETVSHVAVVDGVQSELIKIIHAWNPETGGGSVRYGIIGRYLVPVVRYRLSVL